LTFLSKLQNHHKEYVRSFTWRVMPLHSKFDLTRNWSFFWRNQKFYVADGTVCTKPLRMCSFHQQRWFDSMNF